YISSGSNKHLRLTSGYNNNVVLQSSINNNPMKSTLKELIAKNKELEKSEALTKEAEINDPAIKDSRREFLKRTALGGISLGAFMFSSIEDTVAETTSKVNRYSSPSDLKITDMRVAVLRNVGRTPIIRIEDRKSTRLNSSHVKI